MNTAYQRLDLIQGSDEWKSARLKHITASNVPVLFDQSPYKTRLQYFEELTTGIEAAPSDGKATLFEIGHKAESAGREWMQSNLGFELPPAVLVSVGTPDLLASLDGFNEARRIIFEAKYIGQDALLDVKAGKIKAHHESQVQAQLLVSGAEKCIYFALAPNGDAAVMDILPDKDIQSEIAEATAKFMADVRNGVAPEPSMRDFYCPDDPRFEQLRALKERADASSDAFEALKKELSKKYSGHQRVRAGGVTMIRSIRKGNIAYANIPELVGVDLEKHRGKSIESVSVRFDKKESA